MHKDILKEEIFNLTIVSPKLERVEINLPVSLVKKIINETGRIPALKFDEGNKEAISSLSKKVLNAIENKHLGGVSRFSTSKGDSVNISINKWVRGA